jgi:hypothetical protein
LLLAASQNHIGSSSLVKRKAGGHDIVPLTKSATNNALNAAATMIIPS